MPGYRRRVRTAAVLAVCVLGCGQKESDPAAPSPAPAAAAPAPVAEPTPAPIPPPPGSGVKLTGTVTGPVPADEPKALRMAADTYCKNAHDAPVYSQAAAIGADGAVQWAFVYVKVGLDHIAFPTPEAPVVLDQKGCMYEPHVFGVQTGQTIEIHNSDKTLHNVHALPKRPNKAFNIAHPAVASIVHRRSFKWPEVAVRIKCDVHPWMNAYAGVVPHPFFAVTDANGRFAIADLPPGEYTVAAWHERLGEVEGPITIPGDGAPTLDLAFTEP